MSNVARYSLINYFDVWGNEKEGWEVNNQCEEFNDLVISLDATEKEILNYLKSIGFLSTSDRRRVAIEDLGEDMEIVQKKGWKPLGVLRMKY